MTSSTSSDTLIPWTLHDYISLGEVEKGLSMTTGSTGSSNTTIQDDSPPSAQEIQRLPLLLRLLSTTRHLVSLSIFNDTTTTTTGTTDTTTGTIATSKSSLMVDPLLHRTVERLERVAAIHSVAEGVDVVTCYLVPTMTRKLSRIPPLTRTLDTTELAEVARNPKGNPIRKKQKIEGMDMDMDGPNEEEEEDHDDDCDYDDVNNNSYDDEDNDDDDDHNNNNNGTVDPSGTGNKEKRKKRKRNVVASNGTRRRTSLEIAAEDSQEATVVKTLSELISLVVTSLQPFDMTPDDQPQEEHHKETDHPSELQYSYGKGNLVLTVDDSSLAETGREGMGGAMELSDLGSTIAAIMHHAPVLRSKHVANALCRASVPQMANLMTRMGANCPPSVPSLLLGCIEAYQYATIQKNISITTVAKQGVMALAQLSSRERTRVLHKLQIQRIMWDVQLELAVQDPVVDPMAAVTLLVHQILQYPIRTGNTPSIVTMKLERQHHSSGGEQVTDNHRTLQEEDDVHTSGNQEPTLPMLLFKRPLLYRKALVFLDKQFQNMVQMKRIPRGQLLLLLKAYNCLLLVPCPPATPKFERSKFLVQTLLPSLQQLVDKVTEIVMEFEESRDLPPTCPMDSLIESLHCATILSLARVLEVTSHEPQQIKTEACHEWKQLIGKLPCPSQRVQGFCQGLESAICGDATSVLHAHLISILESLPSCQSSSLADSFSDLKTGLQQVCTLLKPEKQMVVVDDGSLGHLTTTLACLMRQMDHNETTDIDEIVKSSLQTLLSSEKVAVLSSIENEDLTAEFVAKATRRLSNADNFLNVPMVLSSSLERQGSSLFQQPLTEEGAKFLLQLLHAFEYMDVKPKSPFAFDPRSVPLRRALEVSMLVRGTFLRKRLYELTTSHCLDVLLQLERAQIVSLGSNTSTFDNLSRRDAIEAFYQTMRSYIVSTETNPEAHGSERIFIHAKCVLPDADFCSTVCNAFLASQHKPRPTFTYHAFCRDPLVLLKCPLKIWKIRALRRIALAVMSSLLEANAVLVHKSSPLPSAAEEYLAARNVVVVRCLLMCVCGMDSDVSPSDCAMTSGFIRSIISGHGGMIATLIKEGLSERAVDWLVEYVPECMNDSQELLQLLSDRSSLTAAERLVAADAVLRIAIVHGQNDDEEASTMAYAALAQLVDSFFLVIGPVGVPVDALIVDDSGLDVTQISRKAAFRMLKALMRVRGRRTGVRRECGIALQKLAGFCKSESAVTGVAGAVAGRRKTLLKEMYDLIVKAATTMGNHVGAQSTAA